MQNIFREVAARADAQSGAIFKNESALTPEYLPDALVHRQSYITELAYALRNIPVGKKPENLLLVGSSGTGKTSCSRHVLLQLAQYTQKAVPIYVNCWEFSTRFSILNFVATKLGEILPRRGIAADEILDRIGQICRMEKRVPVLVLDEIDRLFVSQKDEWKVLYDFARSGELFGVSFGLIGITNDANLLSGADQRINSSVGFRKLAFEKYTPAQLKDILFSRASEAFFPNALDLEVVPVCAAIGAKNNGDARVSIAALWKAGRLAEKEGVKKVQVSHVKSVSGEVLEEIRNRDIELLSDNEKIIISSVKSNGGRIESGRLYKILSEKKIEERTARNYIEKLVAGGFLNLQHLQLAHGRTREIALA
ncbi:AAA family ATPase [Candidatus Parvarchaeota archaeon]|nr:AAA family ATPase [Candidatus Parvarchaeota archaeon]